MDKREKVKSKKTKKIPFFNKQTAAIVFVLLLIFAYVVLQCLSVVNVRLKTQTALTSTVYETIDTKALVIRDEHIVASTGGSVTVPSVADCEKVKSGGEIAGIFSSDENAKAYSDYLALSNELSYYMEMESQAVGQVTDVESLDADILQNVNSYIRSNASCDMAEAQIYADELNDKFTRRQLLIGNEIDFSSIIKDIEARIAAININSCRPTGYVTADSSGIFSRYSDGLEAAFDYNNVTQLDTETLGSYISEAENTAQADNLGKLITSFEWYFCAVVPADSVSMLKNGSTVDVALSGSDEIYKCRIVSGAEPALGAEETSLILMCDNMNSDIASLRLADIQIRVHSYTGIRMPAEAVHINNGEKGVYALVSSVVEWRKADIIYTGDNYVVLSYNPEESGGIKLYDQVIIQGKELHDGKVYA